MALGYILDTDTAVNVSIIIRRHCSLPTDIYMYVTVKCSVYLSICHVHVLHYAQTAKDIHTISFAYHSPMSHQIELKIGLHRQPLPPQILPQTDPPR